MSIEKKQNLLFRGAGGNFRGLGAINFEYSKYYK